MSLLKSKQLTHGGMKILITGISSGIGKYLYGSFECTGLNRENAAAVIKKLKRTGTDVIIHCAFNSSIRIYTGSIYSYIQDNVFLTEQLTKIPHKKFIYFSSVDVYPKDKKRHSEEESIDLNSLNGQYAITKLVSEEIVKNNCRDYLILRLSGLLGEYSKPNTLIKILTDDKPKLSITRNSSFNYMLHNDILAFLKYALEKDLKGVYNVASSSNLTVHEIARVLKKKVKYGKFHYDVGNIDNRKALSIFPSFNKTTLDVITQFKDTKDA